MMGIFVLTFIIILLAMTAISIGVLAGRAPLKGSCGGNSVVKNCPACKSIDFEEGERP